MNCEEFSNEFDVLINSGSLPESFGMQISPYVFDEYEKSVFLTQAQEQVVRELYSGANGFESTEQIRRYLGSLIENYSTDVENYKGVSPVSKAAFLPEDLMFITYESAVINGVGTCLQDKIIEVVPVTQDEYHRLSQNPFRMPNTRKALRLDLGVNRVELVSQYPIVIYNLRYLRRPRPIVLADIDEDNNVCFTYGNEEIKTKTECELNPDIHRMILEVAVANALKSRSQGKSN